MTINTMDISNQELAAIKTQVSEVQAHANLLKVENQMECDQATDFLKKVKQAEKFVDEKKTDITRPLMKALSNVRDLFKPLELNLSNASSIVKSKILAFTLEEQARIEKEQAKILARVEKGTLKNSTAANKLADIVTPKSNLRTVKKVRVIDETSIPREYLVPNMILITEAILRKGETIPGVEIYEEKSIVAK